MTDRPFRRQPASTSAAAIAAALALLGPGLAEAVAPAPKPSLHAIAAAIPTLRGAAALATLVAIDPRANVAEFRIGCGWYYKPKHRVRRGLWKVPLRGVTFNWETYPNGPASGVAHTLSRRAWETLARLHGWSGTLWLGPGYPAYISDGGTTDICGGVLG